MTHNLHEMFANDKHYVCSNHITIPVNFLFMNNNEKKSEKIAAFNRVEQVINEKNMSPADFQKTLDIDSQNWNNWKNRGLPHSQLIRIAEILNLSVSWLATGRGEQYKNTTEIIATAGNVIADQSNAEYTFQLGQHQLVPVVGTTQLGDNGHWSELDYPVGHGDGAIDYPTRDKNAYALRCRGDSMKPRIKDGEFVIVEPNSEPIPGDEVLLKALDGRIMVKTFLYSRDGRIHLMSINEAHPPQSFALDEIEKIHPIAAIVKKALWVKN